MLTLGRYLDQDARRVVRYYWRAVGGRAAHIVFPLALTLVAALLEGASYSLLVPLADALSQNGFDFLRASRAFGWVTAPWPAEALSSPRGSAYLALTILTLAVLARAGKLVVSYGVRLYANHRDERYYARVQERTFARMMGFGRQYFERKSLGHLDAELGWSRCVVELLAGAEGLLKSVLSMTVKAAVMVALSVPLSLTALVVFPGIVALMGRISRQIERLAQAGTQVELRTRSQVLDLLATVPLVKAFSQEQRAAAVYGEILDEAREVATHRRNLMALRWPVEEILLLTSILLMQGVLIISAESFRPGDLARLAVFLLLVQQILPDLKAIGDFGMVLADQRPKLKALARLLGDEDKYVVTSGDREFTRLERGIEIRGLSFSYADGTQVLKEVSADIPAGSVTAIVGESGAGKSTFVDVVARFYDCPPGTVLLDGVDIRSFSLPSLYRHMAIVSQDVWLLNRTLRENVTYGLPVLPSDADLLKVLAEVGLDDFCREDQPALDLLLGDRGVQVSGGQRQRIALARALLRDPQVLILDEATSALDSVMERKVTSAIEGRFRGRTVLLIAHRLSTVRGADQILVLKAGRIIEQGGWDELLGRSGEFARLYRAQFDESVA